MALSRDASKTRDQVLSALREVTLTPAQIAEKFHVSVKMVEQTAARFEFDLNVLVYLLRLKEDRDRLDKEIERVTNIFLA